MNTKRFYLSALVAGLIFVACIIPIHLQKIKEEYWQNIQGYYMLSSKAEGQQEQLILTTDKTFIWERGAKKAFGVWHLMSNNQVILKGVENELANLLSARDDYFAFARDQGITPNKELIIEYKELIEAQEQRQLNHFFIQKETFRIKKVNSLQNKETGLVYTKQK